MSAETDIAALRAEVERLRTELAELREQLANDVRTRRLVVLDDDGVERIVLAVEETGTATVEVVACRNAIGEPATSIELFAVAPPDRAAEAGLVLIFEEDVSASLDCLDGRTILNVP